jgi:hypothetical protein
MTIYLVVYKEKPTKHAFFKLIDAKQWVESREGNEGQFMKTRRTIIGPSSYHLNDYELKEIFVKGEQSAE